MHKHSQTSVIGPKLGILPIPPIKQSNKDPIRGGGMKMQNKGTINIPNYKPPHPPSTAKISPPANRINKELVEKMVQQYFKFRSPEEIDPQDIPGFNFAKEKLSPENSSDISFSSSSELSEGPIKTPLQTQTKISTMKTKIISHKPQKSQIVIPRKSPISQKAVFTKIPPALSQPSRNIKKQVSPPQKIDPKKATVILPTKEKRYVLHIRKSSHSPTECKDMLAPIIEQPQNQKHNFIKEMVKRGLYKDIAEICPIADTQNIVSGPESTKRVARNLPLESNSSQSTNNSQSNIPQNKPNNFCENQGALLQNNPGLIVFPYQRRNRSASPDKLADLSANSGICSSTKVVPFMSPSPIPKIDSKVGINGPVIAKSFIFGSQTKQKKENNEKSKEGEQVLNVLNKIQENDGEKQVIVDDLDDLECDNKHAGTLKEVSKNEILTKPEQFQKPITYGNSNSSTSGNKPLKVLKAPFKGRHRRVTSQVIDKQTLNRMLLEKCDFEEDLLAK